MAFVAGGRSLVIRILRAARAHDRLEGEDLPGGFADQLVGPIWQDPRIPERFALFGDQDGVAQLQIHHRVEQGLPEGDVIRVGQHERLGQFGEGAMAGLALDVLDLLFIAVQIPIPHRLGAGMAVNTIEGVLAFRELGDGLVIIMQAVGGSIRARLEGHRTQIIVAAVMAGVALGIGDGGGQFMDFGGRAGVHAGQVDGLGRRMAGGSSR